MKTFKTTVSRLLASAAAGATLFTIIGAGSARAQVTCGSAPNTHSCMLRIPGDSPGIPAYARTDSPPGEPFVFRTDEWAAIVFYRRPDCVPSDFNLLKFFDADPPPPPRAFACPLTVSGFELWETGPPPFGSDSAPRHTNLSGLAVPVWFVRWPVLEAAIADNVLTMPELESLTPLKDRGTAKTFHEVLHPIGGPGDPTAGAKVPHLTITATGVLPDGRSFQYEFTSAGFGKPQHVRIVIP